MSRVRYIADSIAEAVTAARRNHGVDVRILHAGVRPGRGSRLAFEVVVEAASPRSRARRAAREALARAVLAARLAAEEASASVDAAARAPGASEALLARLAARLRSRGLPDELAAGVVGRARAEAMRTATPDLCEAVHAAAMDAVAALLPVAAPHEVRPQGPAGRPCVIAVTGATGTGKTTTLAKLAADLRVGRGLRVGLVAGDAFRVGAFEQLRTYARIIDVPVRAADSVASARDALAALAGCDAVLVDTPGRAPHDGGRIGEIGAILAAIRPDETHLVISGASSAAAQLASASAFAAVGPTRVVLSKLDEAAEPGTLVAAVRRSGLASSWFTTGQEVPDDIEAADAHAFARRIVGDGPGAA